MNRLPLYLSLAAMLLAGARADGPAAKPQPYALKNRSSFTLDANTRTPFWPIGWDGKAISVAKPEAAAVKKFALKEHVGIFTVTSILLGNPPLATINGKAYGEGEFLPVKVGEQPIKVVVKAIHDGSVLLAHEQEQLVVPMRRAVVSPRAPEAKAAVPSFEIVIPDK